MKKLLRSGSMLLTMVMAGSLVLSGCGSKEENAKAPASSAAPTTAAATAKPEAKEKAVLKLYTNNQLRDDEPAVIAEINKKLAEKFNATLDVEAALPDKYNLIIASGEAFDMIFTARWKNYGVNATKNAFAEITEDMLQKYAPNVYKNIPKEDWDLCRINKKIYMIPQGSMEFGQRLITIRSDLRKKYNVPEIKSIDDFEKYLEAIAKNEKEMTPFNFMTVELGFLVEMLAQQAGEYNVAGNDVRSFAWGWYKLADPSSSKLVASFDTPEYKEALKRIRSWNQKGYIPKSSLTNTTNGQQIHMQNGKAAAVIHNYGTGNGIFNNTKAAHPDWTYEFFDGTFGKKVTPEPASNGGVAFHPKSKNIDRSMMIVDYLRYDKEMNFLAQRGFKGKHWEVAPGQNNENITVPGPDAAKFGSGWTWGPWRNAMYQTYPDPKSTVPGYQALVDSLKSRAVKHPLLGFNFSSESVKSEITNIQQVETQYGFPLLSGFVDVEQGLATYKEKLKAAGFDKVLAEMQKQADEYMKNVK